MVVREKNTIRKGKTYGVLSMQRENGSGRKILGKSDIVFKETKKTKTQTVKKRKDNLPVVIWTYGNQSTETGNEETTSSTINPRYSSGVFVVEVVKLYINEEVEVRGYTGIVYFT